jgi:hypothetical protein
MGLVEGSDNLSRTRVIRRDRYYPALISAGILVLGRILPMPLSDGSILHMPGICPFRMLTGLPCPLCGMTRSVISAMHGHFAESFAYHPLGIAFCIGLIVLIIVNCAKSLRPDLQQKLSFALNEKQILIGIAAIFLVAWLGRLMGFDPLPIGRIG